MRLRKAARVPGEAIAGILTRRLWFLRGGMLMDQPSGPPDVDSAASERLWPEPPDQRGGDDEPHAALWPYYLFLRPRIFFEHFVLAPATALTALAAWMLGIASTIKEMQPPIPGEGFPYDWAYRGWDQYWMACFVLGIISGLLFFVIGGWWYRMRLRWSGASEPDKSLARRVYLFASQVWALPIIAHTIGDSIRYDSPVEAYAASNTLGMVMAVFLLWSVYTSYRGVRTAFDVRKWAARCWFAILPGLCYGMVVLGAVGADLLGALDELPAVDQPAVMDRPGFSLNYPGNWLVDDAPPDYDPDTHFEIGPWIADALVTFSIIDTPPDAEALLQQRLAEWEQNHTIESREPFEHWGDYEGNGLSFVAADLPWEYHVRVFAAVVGSGGFMVEEYAEVDCRELQTPGLELIESTFRMKE